MAGKIKIDTKYVESIGKNLMYKPYDDDLGFAFVSSPNSGRQQVTKSVMCRDHVHESIRDHLADCEKSCNKQQPLLDFNRLRLLLLTSETMDFKDSIFSGKRALNVYEKMAGWKNKSKIASIDFDGPAKAYLITGPKQWMSHPTLISMVTLIVRVGMRFGDLPSTEKEMVERWEQISDTVGISNIDSRYVREAHEYFPILVNNYDELFTTDAKDTYKDVGHSNAGIVALARNENQDDTLYDACKKYRKMRHIT